jgi:alpha-L-arabinofuranosidase
LDVVAASDKSGGAITLFVVNRSLDTDIAANIKLPGIALHSASGQLLTAQDIYVGNDDAQPNAVTPKRITESVSGSTFSYTFPKASVTMMELK